MDGSIFKYRVLGKVGTHISYDFRCWGVALLLQVVKGGSGLILTMGPLTAKLVISW